LFALQGMKKLKGQDEKDILEKLSILFIILLTAINENSDNTL
jgi:hypothetical protein